MMLAVAAAAGRQAGVRTLRECEQRRNQGKRKGREQQNGEQASHGIPDGSSVRPRSQWARVDLSLCGWYSVQLGRVVV